MLRKTAINGQWEDVATELRKTLNTTQIHTKEVYLPRRKIRINYYREYLFLYSIIKIQYDFSEKVLLYFYTSTLAWTKLNLKNCSNN